MPKRIVFDAQETVGEVDSIDLVLSGQTYTVYKPTSGQTAIMMSNFADDSMAPDGMKALLSFYKDITDPLEDDVPGSGGYEAIVAILSDPRIEDSLEQVMDLTQKVIEAFTGNPTKQPTDYLRSQRSGGRNSTGSQRRPASTRSISRPRGSATGSTGITSRAARPKSDD